MIFLVAQLLAMMSCPFCSCDPDVVLQCFGMRQKDFLNLFPPFRCVYLLFELGVELRFPSPR